MWVFDATHSNSKIIVEISERCVEREGCVLLSCVIRAGLGGRPCDNDKPQG